MKQVKGKLMNVFGVKEEENTMRLTIVPKDDKTRAFLEKLNAKPQEPEPKLVYYKMRNGRIVDQIWSTR